eukprot:TRINITY_DN500_c5_g4_i3.p1 TRINITY_DN500_c5_g4~~TRINITY_DN500_c5_g4_i3.p1  ORF type:complete len:342 (+),score=23.03 TRINITY_DN500_c5_g4_i3:93-1118(+)
MSAMDLHSEMRKRFETDTYWGRVKYVFGGMNPLYIASNVNSRKYAGAAIRMSPDELSKLNISEANYKRLYKEYSYITSPYGEYMPLLGRLSFLQLPQYLGMYLSMKACLMVEMKDRRKFITLRTFTHGMFAGVLGAFSILNGGNTNHTKKEYAYCLIPSIVAGVTLSMGAEVAASRFQLTSSWRSRLLYSIPTIVLPSLSLSAVTILSRMKEWMTSQSAGGFLFNETGIPFYDDKGNELGVSKDLGWFAVRETASLRFLQGLVVSSLFTLVNQTVSNYKVPIYARFGTTAVTGMLIVLSNGIYLASWPFIPTLTPVDTSIPTRRVKDIDVPHKVVFYNRGF